jgi:hypothetical protein
MRHRSAVLALSIVVVSLLASPAFANHRPATVFVTHGIPGANGFPVDISVAGPGGTRACLSAVTFATVAGPWYVPAGTYTIAIRPASRRACSADPVLGPLDVPLEAGEDAAIVAHLTADGAPTAGKYAVDLRPAGFGKARVNVYHLAAAPAVDIAVTRGDRTALELADVENGDSAAAGFRPGAYGVTIAPAGSPNPVFGPVNVRFRPFVAYLVFAIGSLADGSFTLASGQTWVRPR